MSELSSLRARLRGRAPLACALVLTTVVACDSAGEDPAREPPHGERPGAEAPAMTTPATGSPPPELRAAAERFESAWDGDDPDAVARFFTEDATASVADVTLSGRDDIAAGWIAPAVPIISRLRLMEDSIRPGGDGWRSDGTYTHDATLPGAETVRDHRGRYSFTWTREAHGDWLIRSFQVHPDQLGGAGGLGGPAGQASP
jgi:ketosteroid isomerase-like protein